MITQCAKCKKEIEIPCSNKNDWLKITNSNDLPFKDKTEGCSLIYLKNIFQKKNNVWLCKDCYELWHKFNSKGKCSWSSNWLDWFFNKIKEVVNFD